MGKGVGLVTTRRALVIGAAILATQPAISGAEARDLDNTLIIELASGKVTVELRPDLLGSITAYFDDGGFTDVSYFTSEQDAREHERQPMPEQMAEAYRKLQEVMQIDRYLDLPQPWLTTPAR